MLTTETSFSFEPFRQGPGPAPVGTVLLARGAAR